MQFPGLNCSGSQVPRRDTDSDGLCVLSPSQVWAAQKSRCMVSTLSLVGRASYSPPWSQLLGFPGAQEKHSPKCTMCLLWGANLRLWYSWQMWMIQDPRKMWLSIGSLLTVWWKMRPVGPRLQQSPPFQLWFSYSCLSASWEGGPIGQQVCSPLVFAQSFVLWAHQGSPWGIRACHRKGFCFCFFSFLLSLKQSHSLSCYLRLAPSDCPLGIQTWSLP